MACWRAREWEARGKRRCGGIDSISCAQNPREVSRNARRSPVRVHRACFGVFAVLDTLPSRSDSMSVLKEKEGAGQTHSQFRTSPAAAIAAFSAANSANQTGFVNFWEFRGTGEGRACNALSVRVWKWCGAVGGHYRFISVSVRQKRGKSRVGENHSRYLCLHTRPSS